jgi:aminoglycoside phosphotransferase (APT) family kinase protein
VPAVTNLPMALAPDAALPFRDVLLDEDAAGETLAILGRPRAARVSACRAIRVNYQVGRSLRAVLEVTINGAPHTVAARMFRSGRSASAYSQAQRLCDGDGDLRGVAWAPDIETVFWLFPNDRKIHTLASVLDPASSVPPGIPGRVVHRKRVAYAPEKTATVACIDSEGRAVAYVKVAAAHQAARDFRTYETLGRVLGRRNPHLYLPSALAYWTAERTLWLEAVNGRRMADAADVDVLDDLRRLGTAVAVFHGLPASAAPPFDRFAGPHLAAESTLVGLVRPDVASAARHLADRLASTRLSDDNEPVCLHGDLHPKNAILFDDRVSLLDLEDVAAGPAAADLGSLLASLLYLQVANRLSRSAYSARAAAFLSGYADNRPLPTTASLAWHTAAALFIERAVRAVTRMRPLGLAHMGALMSAAERLLDTGAEVTP